MSGLVAATAPQVKGAHDAQMALVNGRAYVVAEVNDEKPGEGASWPFVYAAMSIVNLKTLAVERIIPFARSEQAFENETLPVGACFVPRIIHKDARTLRCCFASEQPGNRQSQTWFLDFDLAAGTFENRIHRAKLRTAAGVFDRFPDNVVIETNRYVPEYFRAWAPFKVPMAVYISNWFGWTPKIAPRCAVDQIRLWVENDVQGIYVMGGLDCSSGSPWGLNGPSYYAFGKAMEDPTRNADMLEEEYVAAAFGEAAAPMRAFFQAMHRRLEIYALFDKREQGIPDRRYRGYEFNREPGDFLCHFFSPPVLNEMNADLQRALPLSSDEKVKARLELVEAEFNYLRSVASVRHMHRAYQIAPSWESFDLLAAQVQQHRDTLAWLYPDGKKTRTIAGLRSPLNGANVTEGRRAAEATPPFAWNFAELREQGTLPPVDARGPSQNPGGGFSSWGLPPHRLDRRGP